MGGLYSTERKNIERKNIKTSENLPEKKTGLKKKLKLDRKIGLTEITMK